MRSLCRISYKGPFERRISFFTPVDLHAASPTSPHSTVYRAYDLYNLLHLTSTKPSRHSTTLVARSQDSMQLRIFALLTVSTAALFSGVQAQNYQCPNNAGYSLCCQSFGGSSASGCNSLYPGPSQKQYCRTQRWSPVCCKSISQSGSSATSCTAQ